MLVSSEIDNSILSLMTTTLMPYRDSSSGTTACVAFCTNGKAFLGFIGCQLIANQINSVACTF